MVEGVLVGSVGDGEDVRWVFRLALQVVSVVVLKSRNVIITIRIFL